MTDPICIPKDVAQKLVECRDAILSQDYDEAWHQLYAIADPEFASLNPWEVLESIANAS